MRGDASLAFCNTAANVCMYILAAQHQVLISDSMLRKLSCGCVIYTSGVRKHPARTKTRGDAQIFSPDGNLGHVW